MRKLTAHMIEALNHVGTTGDVYSVHPSTLRGLIARELVWDDNGVWFLTSDAHNLDEVTDVARDHDLARQQERFAQPDVPEVIVSQADMDAVLAAPDTYVPWPTQADLVQAEADALDDGDASDVLSVWGDLMDDVWVHTTPFARLYAVYVAGREVGCITGTERGYVAYQSFEDGDEQVGEPTDDMDHAALLVMLAVS